MKILLVEDDNGAAEVLKNTLINQHYLVDVAIDGQAGLSLARSFAYDLIVFPPPEPSPPSPPSCQILCLRPNCVGYHVAKARRSRGLQAATPEKK